MIKPPKGSSVCLLKELATEDLVLVSLAFFELANENENVTTAANAIRINILIFINLVFKLRRCKPTT